LQQISGHKLKLGQSGWSWHLSVAAWSHKNAASGFLNVRSPADLPVQFRLLFGTAATPSRAQNLISR
jgi:hypothetical protein